MEGIFDRYRPIIDDWPAFLDALDRPLRPVVWTNELRTTPEALRRRLAADGLDPEPLSWYPGAWRLAAGARPGKTLAFLCGHYHVQEEVSLLPVVVLDPQPGEDVLDLCAAPGNKTVQSAVRMRGRGSLLANDKSRRRSGLILRNLERLGITCVATSVHDGATLPRSAGPFDRVLADVPCSCEGTTRKNPAVLFRQALPARARGRGQLDILRLAIRRCRPGGRVVYSTCTYAPEENEEVVDAAVRENEGRVRLLPARVPGLRSAPGLTAWRDRSYVPEMERAMRIYPHFNDTGGFFVALLERTAE